MEIEEFINNLELAIENLDTYLIQTNESAAVTARSLVVNRIQNEGVHDGMARYSTNKLNPEKLLGTELRAGAAAELREKGSMSYEEWRVANGLQVDHVDLTYSGRMFQNFQVQGTNREGNSIVTVISVTQQDEIKKMEANKERYGDFLEITEKEKDLLILDFEDELIQKLAL